ncbi:MAG: carboxypeptidase regulatory-like domain-containing protein [Caldilineaceae bacterium]|nr:carboxypeptidase regulatory-like domain-containing protein [Caldilineaceae bacterium]
MDLHEYPRPANDTGLGVHWTVGFASAIGMGKIRDFWVPELKAMGIKWVKIFNHDGAIDFAELLLAEGFMPIVRIYRPSPYPSAFDLREIVNIDALVRAGVRYFEFNPEPDRDTEWKGGRVPSNAIELAVENIIANLDTILERGGMPAIPAVANGSRWDLVGKIVARGRKDIFNGPVWHAIHNYSRNRPLDYPYDIGNQEGASYTQRFYQTLEAEAWGEDAWRGRPLHEVNKLRLERCNPGATIMDDNACWLAYEFIDARNRRHLGRSIPLLSTECGYLVGEDGDARYPATTPDLHMAQTLEACRVMMGTSNRFQSAPDYYFCSAFWLLGNAALGSASTWCEHHAWYSERWGGGVLPIVRALKAEPKAVRRWQEDVPVGARTILHGTVLHAADRRTLILEQGSLEVARATLDANSRYVIPDLLPGNYSLRVEGTAIEQPVSLTPGQESAVVNLDLAEIFALSGSTLTGKVRGGAGAVVLLLRTSDGEEWVTMAKDTGGFRFIDLPPGFYNVRVQGEGSHVSGIMLDGKNQREVELAVAGWGHTIETLETTGARGPSIRCRVENRPGVTVRANNGDWQSEPVETGSAPDIGPDGCEIPVMEPGYYVVEVMGLTNLADEPVKLEAYVNVEPRAIPLVEFVYSDLEYLPTDLRNSAIRGRVVGGCTPERRLRVRLTDEQANRVEQPVSAECTFAFEGLGAGQYTVELVGFADTASRSDIALDGKNTVAIELMAPVEDTFSSVARRRSSSPNGISVIAGSAPESGGRVAKLTDSVGNEARQVVQADDTFRFEGLMAGVYLLTIEGGYEQPGLIVDGESGLEVIFQTLTSTWEAKVSPAGSMPGYSVVRVEVEGMRGLPVYIWKEDWEGMMRRTGSKPEYGESAAEFSPLGPGHYMIEPEGIGVWADVELTGLEVVWIDFRRKNVPTSPNVVQTLGRPTITPPPAVSAPAEAWDNGNGGFDEAHEGELGDRVDGKLEELPSEALYDEPTFEDESFDSEGFGGERFDESRSEGEAPFEPDRFDDEPGWRSSLATSSAMDFQLPSLTRGDDEDELADYDADFEDDFEDEDDQARAAVQVTPEVGQVPVEETGAAETGEAAEATSRAPLCLLIPTPVTDLDDLAALLRFVAATQSTMARSVDEVPAGSRVLLIGTTGTEEWTEIEQQLTSRGLIFERVEKKLSEALADDSFLGL